MRIAKLHIVVVLLLTLVYLVESSLPCIDFRSTACDSSCETMSESGSDQSHDAPSDQEHPCHHCACPCHLLALNSGVGILLDASASDIRYLPFTCSPPQKATYPPDHIPLA